MISFKNFLTELYWKKTKGVLPTYSDEWGQQAGRYTKSLNALHEHLAKHSALSHDDPTKWRAINGYTGSSFLMNGHCHEKYENPNHDNPYNEDRCQRLDKELEGHKAPFSFHVYSGLKESPVDTRPSSQPFRTTHIGRSVVLAHLPAFTSSSLSIHTARNFANIHDYREDEEGNHESYHVLKFHIPKGSEHGTYVGHISHHHDEREFLIKRGRNIAIHPVPEIKTTIHPNDAWRMGKKEGERGNWVNLHKHIHIWHAHILDD